MKTALAFLALLVFWYYAGTVIGLVICGILHLVVG